MPIAGVTRELVIVYGTYTVGGATGIHPTGVFSWHDDYVTRWFSFEFEIVVATAAALAGAVASAEAAYRQPRQNFSVTMGGNSYISWSHSGNTGLNTTPSIEKVGAATDNGCRQRMRARVQCEAPADNLSLSGRRVADVTISYSESRRRTITISGEYTATAGTGSAYTTYTAQVGAFCTSVLSGIGGTYELLTEDPIDYMETDKVLKFRRQYQELVFDQPGGGNNAGIVNQMMTIDVKKVGPGDTFISGVAVRRLATVNVSYSASLDASVSTDLNGYISTAKSFIATKVAALGLGTAVLIDDTDKREYDENRFSITQQYEIGTTGWVELQVSTRLTRDHGKTLVPVWEGVSSVNFPNYVYQGPAMLRCTIRETGMYYGQLTVVDGLYYKTNIPTTRPDAPSGHEWVTLQDDEDATPLFRGTFTSTTRRHFTKWTATRVYQAANMSIQTSPVP